MFYRSNNFILDSDLNYPSDDFQALFLLLANLPRKIAACSATGGNTWVEEVWHNLCAALDVVGRSDLPVLSATTPNLVSTRHSWAINQHVRGVVPFVGAYNKSDRTRLALPNKQNANDLSSYLTSRESVDKVDVIAIGPLTNIARTLKQTPDAASKINQILFMGGNFCAEAGSDRSDFNVWFDPLSAQEVFNSNIPITVLPLNVCRTVRSSQSLIESLDTCQNEAAGIFCDDFKSLAIQHGTEMTLCDQLAALIYIDSGIITSMAKGRVVVHTEDEDLCGHTVFVENPAETVSLITAVDVSRALALLARSMDVLKSIKVNKEVSTWVERLL